MTLSRKHGACLQPKKKIRKKSEKEIFMASAVVPRERERERDREECGSDERQRERERATMPNGG
jgi:hypothetical protein